MASSIFARADEIAAVIEALPELAGVDVVVNRQKDLDATVEAAVAKAKGLLVLIGVVRGRNNSEYAAGPRLDVVYSVSVWSLPIINEDAGNLPNFEVTEVIMQALHSTFLTEGVDKRKRMKVGQFVLVPDDDYLIYETSVELTVQL